MQKIRSIVSELQEAKQKKNKTFIDSEITSDLLNPLRFTILAKIMNADGKYYQNGIAKHKPSMNDLNSLDYVTLLVLRKACKIALLCILLLRITSF